MSKRTRNDKRKYMNIIRHIKFSGTNKLNKRCEKYDQK